MANARCIVLIGSHIGENLHNAQVQTLSDALRNDVTLITVDPHLHRTRRLADAVPVRRAVAVTAAPLMADWIAEHTRDALLIGPDEESAQWVSAIAAPGKLDYGVAHKQRLGDRSVQLELPVLDFAARHVVLADDLVSTTHKLLKAAIDHRIDTAPMPFFVKPVAKGITGKVRSSYLDANVANNLVFMEQTLSASTWFCGDRFSAADVQMSFPLEAAEIRSDLAADYPHLARFLRTIRQRPAYKAALDRGGHYELMGANKG